MRAFTFTTTGSAGNFEQLSAKAGFTGTGLLRVSSQTQPVDIVFAGADATEALAERTADRYARISTSQTYGNIETVGHVDLETTWVRSASATGTVLSCFIGP